MQGMPMIIPCLIFGLKEAFETEKCRTKYNDEK
jgi:hypothetical protein